MAPSTDLAQGMLAAPGMCPGRCAASGTWLEELAGGRRDEFAELLAYHFGAAADEETAELAWPEPADRQQVRARGFRHLVQAGAAARRRFAVAKAVELHEQAGALASTDQERRVVLEELGDDQGSAYHGEEATAWWAQALAGARADPAGGAERARLCRKLAWIMAATPGAFRSVPDPVPIGERIADVEQALTAGDADGDEDLVTAASSALKVLSGVAGRYAEVLALGRRDLEGLASVRSRLEQADILRTAAVNAIMIGGQLEDGLGLARRSHELSAGADPHQLMHATWPMLTALYHLGRWRELPPILDEHVDAFRQDPAPGCSFVRDGPVVGATVLAHTGELDRARTLAAVVGDPMADLDTASAWKARFAIASGDPEAARRISVDKARERRLYGPQHVHALLEALVALEDWPGVTELLPLARAAVVGNALLAPACDRAGQDGARSRARTARSRGAQPSRS